VPALSDTAFAGWADAARWVARALTEGQAPAVAFTAVFVLVAAAERAADRTPAWVLPGPQIERPEGDLSQRRPEDANLERANRVALSVVTSSNSLTLQLYALPTVHIGS